MVGSDCDCDCARGGKGGGFVLLPIGNTFPLFQNPQPSLGTYLANLANSKFVMLKWDWLERS